MPPAVSSTGELSVSHGPDGITVDIRRFEADAAGIVTLDATWRVHEDGRAVAGNSTLIEESAGGIDRGATVAAQSRALAGLSREIASGVRGAQGRIPDW